MVPDVTDLTDFEVTERGADDDPKGGADDDQDDRNFAKDVQTGGAGVFQRYLPLKAMLTALLL